METCVVRVSPSDAAQGAASLNQTCVDERFNLFREGDLKGLTGPTKIILGKS